MSTTNTPAHCLPMMRPYSIAYRLRPRGSVIRNIRYGTSADEVRAAIVKHFDDYGYGKGSILGVEEA